MLMSLTTRLRPIWPDNSWGTTSVVAIPIPFLSKSCNALTGQTPFARKFSGVKSENSLLYASECGGSNQNGNRRSTKDRRYPNRNPSYAASQRACSARSVQFSPRRGRQTLSRLQERTQVRLVDQGRTGIHETGNGRINVLRPVRSQRRRLVMIKSVQHLHADVAHGVRLLRDRGRDLPLLYPVERLRIGVHRHNHLAGHAITIEQSGDLFARLRLQADKGVNFVFLLADNFRGGIKSNSRIALYIDHARDLDVRRTVERVFVAALAILQIGLRGHSENNHVAFALEFLRQAWPSREACLVAVGADKKEPLAGRCIRVHCDYRDARSHRLVDAVLEQSGIGDAQQYARGFLLHRLIQSVALRLGVVGLRADEIKLDLHPLRSLGKPGARSPPIRHLQVGRHENEIFVGVVRRATTEKSRQQSGNTSTVEELMREEHQILL